MISQPLPTGIRTRRFEHTSPESQAAELARLPIELRQERTWLESAGLAPYEDKTSALGDIALGRLVPVPTGPELPFRQYYQDRVADDALRRLAETDFSIPYLRPESLATMMRVALGARKLMANEESCDYMQRFGLSNVQYSITSMTRTSIYQKRLTSENALAFDGDSAHTFGVAFDVDHSGYYVRDSRGRTIAVNGLQNSELYSDMPIHAFQSALEDAAERGELAFITELPEGRGCWHVATNPISSLDHLDETPEKTAVLSR